MTDFLQLLVSGIQIGGVLGLLSMGLALMFGVMGIINFAQGDFVMLGLYAVVLITGVVALPSLVLSVVLFVPALVVGLAIYYLVIKRVSGVTVAGADAHTAQLLATLALSLVIVSVVQMTLGVTPRSLTQAQSLAVWQIGGVTIDQPRTIALGVSIALAVVMMIVLRRTPTGRRTRAAATNPESAQYVGIDVSRIYAGVFAVSIALTVVAGGVLASYYSVQPFTGREFLLLMFTAVVLGGLGNVMGALVGGLILGVVQSVSQLLVPLQLVDAVVFGAFLAILLLRPQGLFGTVERL